MTIGGEEFTDGCGTGAEAGRGAGFCATGEGQTSEGGLPEHETVDRNDELDDRREDSGK